MRRAVAFIIVYFRKSREIVWKAARCLKMCDRLSSPLSVMLLQLKIRRNEARNSGCCSLLADFKSDLMESNKINETL